ncbi:MAG: hypothetical protein IJ524_07560 [Bacteroidales bacterium]|nr:hypothetical protein [Bacteroidales bacterium]
MKVLFPGIFPFIGLLALLVAGFFYCYTPVPPEKLATFYDKHQAGLEELVNYANAAIDDSSYFSIHLYPNGDIGLQGMACDDTSIIFDGIQGRNSLMQRVGLTEQEHEGLCQRLRNLGCIEVNVEKDRRTNYVVYKYGSWFDESPFGLLLYSSPMTVAERAENMANEHRIPYSDRMVFSGQFWKKKKTRWLRKHPW